MAKEKPKYEVNEEFAKIAGDVVGKYPDKFNNVDVDAIRCVNITNKTRAKKKEVGNNDTERIWKLDAVKMPMALDCPYGWYVTLYSDDWDYLEDKHKAALVADVLHGVSEEEGKVNPCDTKGYHSIFKTLGLDFLTDPTIPNILQETVEWK